MAPFSPIMSTVAIASLLSGIAQAHVRMALPVPFSGISKSPLNNVAIGSATSNYPCQLQFGVQTINEMKVGDQQILAFNPEDTATHGGGTCQLAVALDEKPTAQSTFKLIQVYEGGCPTTGAGNDPSQNFTFSIPENFPNGRATLAWTWYNKVGNREIYMNCAPIDVSGGSDSKDYYNSLPDQYIINLPTSDCTSVEGTIQEIPNPGKFVEKELGSASLGAASGSGCAAAAAAQTAGLSSYSGGSSGGSSGGPASGSGSGPSSSAGAYSGAPGSTQAPVASSSAVAAGPSSSALPVSSSPVVSAGPGAGSYAPSAAPSASGMTTLPAPGQATSYPTLVPSANAGVSPYDGSGNSATGTGTGTNSNPATSTGDSSSAGGNACSNEGGVVCNGSDQFGLCDHGHVVWQQVASGTTCSNGAIQKKKRSWGVVRDAAHVRRHARRPAF